MKLGERSINILKNFVAINPSLKFTPGNIISTISPTKTVLATATISETIAKPFAVYDLSKFLSTLSLFNAPDVQIEDKYMIIEENDKSVKYHFSDPTLIITPPDKKIDIPRVDVSFTLSNDALTSVKKALNVLNLDSIAFIGDGSTVKASAVDSAGAVADTFSIIVGNTEDTFKSVFKASNLLLIPDDYQVDVCAQGMAKFSSADLTYLVAVEKSLSSFN